MRSKDYELMMNIISDLQEIHYGDQGCMKNESIQSSADNLWCSKADSEDA